MISQTGNPYLDVDRDRIDILLSSNDPDSGRLRRIAMRLIIEAMDDTENREVTAINDLGSLPLSLWILKYIDEPLLTSRAINHSRDLLERFLTSERLHAEDVPDYARRYGVEMEFSDEDDLFRIALGTFVMHTSRLSGYRYRLVYQSIHHGIVYTDRESAVKVIREAFVRKAFEAYATIDKEDTAKFLYPLSDNIQEIVEKLKNSGIKKDIDLGEVDFTIFPPCIKEYISQMRDGVNLPHMARFTMVSFLHKIGMDNDGIIGLFKTAPDFNERLTTYQVNHVTGGISSTEYSPPKCSVLQSNHLCYKGDDPICNKDWLKHPLQYYTYKKWKKSPKPPLDKLKKG